MSKEGNPFVAIAAVLGGILLTIIIVVLIFAKEFVVPIMPTLVWGFVVLGGLLGFFASRKK